MPSAVVVLTLKTVGAVVSTTIALLKSSEPAAPGEARVNTASFPAASRIVLPPLVSALADAYAKSLEECPAAML